MAGVASAIIGGIGVVEGGVKIAEGLSQKAEAKKIAKNNPFTPEDKPYEVGLATKLAQENFTNGMPGQVAAKQGIAQSQANAGAIAAKGATSSGDVLDSANKIALSGQDATRALAVQAASYKSNALGGYEAALGNEASVDQQLYKNNELDPYLRAANTAASLQGAGAINEFSGLDTIGTSAQSYLSNQQNSKYKNYLMSNPKGGANPYTVDTPINSPNMLAAMSQISTMA